MLDRFWNFTRQSAALTLLLLTLVASLPASGARERWVPPLARPIDIVVPYRAPPHPYAAGHRGIDIPASPGERVLVPASGTVSFAGTVVDRATVTVRIDDRTLISIEPVTAAVSVGAGVRRGDLLGTVSTGGHCAAECVHVGVRVGGAYVNPMRFFAGRPVLLPWEGSDPG